MDVPGHILNEIADYLEAGFICYLRKDSLEIVAIPDADRFWDMEEDAWKEDRKKVNRNRKKYIAIEKMESRDSFRVMAAFADDLEDSSTKIRLITALEGHKPFANFNFQIHNAGDYREAWFAFRRQRNIEWVKDQINFVFNNDEDHF